MTVKLQTFARKYIGLSTDDKPVTDDDGTVPVGSTFYEEDRGTTATWDGYRWGYPPLDDRVVDRLESILTELRELKELHQGIVASL